MKKKKILILALIPILLLSACGKKDEAPKQVVEYGDLEGEKGLKGDDDENEDKEEDLSEAKIPTYDPTSASQPKAYEKDRKIEIKDSYYKTQLSARTKRAFDAVYDAVKNFVGTVEFESSQLITPAELEKVMHIIFLDCPEVWHVDTVFSYSTNSDGYVNRVYINYLATKEQYEQTKNDLAEDKPMYISNIKSNDFTSATAIIKSLYFEYENVGLNNDGSYNTSCNLPFNKHGGKNSVGYARLVAYWLRECGIDCTVAIGEPVSDFLKDNYELTTDYIRFKEVTESDGITTIKYNYSCYWIWNIVKIDDQWYNVDYTYSTLMHDVSRTKPLLEELLFFVPDIVMSQTRLSYMNEEMLGIIPSCTDNNYQLPYRNGNYVLAMTETQTVKKLQEVAANIAAQNSKNVKFQFENEETFNYFLNHIDEQIENYNKTNGNPIGLYSVEVLRDALTINIYDIIHNF